MKKNQVKKYSDEEIKLFEQMAQEIYDLETSGNYSYIEAANMVFNKHGLQNIKPKEERDYVNLRWHKGVKRAYEIINREIMKMQIRQSLKQKAEDEKRAGDTWEEIGIVEPDSIKSEDKWKFFK